MKEACGAVAKSRALTLNARGAATIHGFNPQRRLTAAGRGGPRAPSGMKLLVGFVWLLSWLPFRVISALGWLIGSLIAALPSSRRRIGDVNLRLCLPELSDDERRRLLRRHFVA
ncbi:MAG: hypothetical protein EOO80_01020, partial [Oxalobacteraceae bacterium]